MFNQKFLCKYKLVNLGRPSLGPSKNYIEVGGYFDLSTEQIQTLLRNGFENWTSGNGSDCSASYAASETNNAPIKFWILDKHYYQKMSVILVCK